MDMQNEAKVFGDGDITIVVNRTTAAARVFAGTQLIGFVHKLKLDLDMKEITPQLEFSFPQSHDQDVNLRIEEQVRAIRQHAPWARINR